MIPALLVAHALDLGTTLVVLDTYGLAAEANPVMAAVLSLGPLAGIAFKAALLAIILAAAALNERARRPLLVGATGAGAIGALSGLAVLA